MVSRREIFKGLSMLAAVSLAPVDEKLRLVESFAGERYVDPSAIEPHLNAIAAKYPNQADSSQWTKRLQEAQGFINATVKNSKEKAGIDWHITADFQVMGSSVLGPGRWIVSTDIGPLQQITGHGDTMWPLNYVEGIRGFSESVPAGKFWARNGIFLAVVPPGSWVNVGTFEGTALRISPPVQRNDRLSFSPSQELESIRKQFIDESKLDQRIQEAVNLFDKRFNPSEGGLEVFPQTALPEGEWVLWTNLNTSDDVPVASGYLSDLADVFDFNHFGYGFQRVSVAKGETIRIPTRGRAILFETTAYRDYLPQIIV